MTTRGSRPVTALSILAAFFLLAFPLIALGCGDDTTTTTAGVTTTGAGEETTSTTTGGAATNTVNMKNIAFDPPTIRIEAGDTVTWVNQEAVPHNAIADDGSFKSPDFGEGGTYSFTFENPGTYPYTCTLHPGMDGTVIVE